MPAPPPKPPPSPRTPDPATAFTSTKRLVRDEAPWATGASTKTEDDVSDSMRTASGAFASCLSSACWGLSCLGSTLLRVGLFRVGLFRVDGVEFSLAYFHR